MASEEPASKGRLFPSLFWAALAFAVWATVSAAGASPTIATFDVPKGVTVWSALIDDTGEIAGAYSTQKGTQRIYTRSKAGTFQSYDVPADEKGISVDGISKGVVTGWYISGRQGETSVSFVLPPVGPLTYFSMPSAQVTNALAINKTGIIVGNYLVPKSAYSAFIRSPDGSIEALNVPGSDQTLVSDINASGTIVGFGGAFDQSFVRAANGSVTVFGFPGARATGASSINKKGDIAGCFDDASLARHAFIRTRAGQFTQIDVPGAAITCAIRINNNSYVIGYSTTQPNGGDPYQGFIRKSDGSMEIVAVPQSPEVWLFSINNANEISGIYVDQNGVRHGMIVTP